MLFSLDVDVSAAIKDGLPWELVEFSADRLITIKRKYNSWIQPHIQKASKDDWCFSWKLQLKIFFTTTQSTLHLFKKMKKCTFLQGSKRIASSFLSVLSIFTALFCNWQDSPSAYLGLLTEKWSAIPRRGEPCHPFHRLMRTNFLAGAQVQPPPPNDPICLCLVSKCNYCTEQDLANNSNPKKRSYFLQLERPLPPSTPYPPPSPPHSPLSCIPSFRRGRKEKRSALAKQRQLFLTTIAKLVLLFLRYHWKFIVSKS